MFKQTDENGNSPSNSYDLFTFSKQILFLVVIRIGI